MTSPRDSRSPRARRAALVGVSLVVTLVAVELLLRLVGPGAPAPPAPKTIDPYGPNPYVVSYRPSLHQFLPGARYRARRPSYVVDYEINALGLRGPEIGPKADRRLVVLGDSIVEGHGVQFDETFVARLDRALAPDSWSVTSAGIQGASPIHYAANVERTLSLEPDAVLLVLYENDLWEDRTKEQGYFDLPPRPSGSPSRLWALVRNALGATGDPALEALIAENRDTPVPETEPDPISHVVIPKHAFDAQWPLTEKYLDHLADQLEAHDVPLFVTTFALGALVPRVPKTHHAHARRLQRAARTWAKRRGLPFLSLYPVAKRAFAELPWENVMLADDGHPTREMHGRLEATLEPWLRSSLPR